MSALDDFARAQAQDDYDTDTSAKIRDEKQEKARNDFTKSQQQDDSDTDTSALIRGDLIKYENSDGDTDYVLKSNIPTVQTTGPVSQYSVANNIISGLRVPTTTKKVNDLGNLGNLNGYQTVKANTSSLAKSLETKLRNLEKSYKDSLEKIKTANADINKSKLSSGLSKRIREMNLKEAANYYGLGSGSKLQEQLALDEALKLRLAELKAAEDENNALASRLKDQYDDDVAYEKKQYQQAVAEAQAQAEAKAKAQAEAQAKKEAAAAAKLLTTTKEEEEQEVWDRTNSGWNPEDAINQTANAEYEAGYYKASVVNRCDMSSESNGWIILLNPRDGKEIGGQISIANLNKMLDEGTATADYNPQTNEISYFRLSTV